MVGLGMGRRYSSNSSWVINVGMLWLLMQKWGGMELWEDVRKSEFKW
jgi:hypothetical protein